MLLDTPCPFKKEVGLQVKRAQPTALDIRLQLHKKQASTFQLMLLLRRQMPAALPAPLESLQAQLHQCTNLDVASS